MVVLPVRTLARIGQGGFGVVDQVVDMTGKLMALKTFQLNQPHAVSPELRENIRKRFVREASVQAALNHECIVPVLISFLENEPPMFLMPLADSTLSKDILQSKTLNGQFLIALMDILSGLEELHRHHIYHRDLKPQNVLRFNNRYAISDFGLISLNDTQVSVLTQTGMHMGSDFYTAPEIVRDLRAASPRSDIYSVGCILHDFVGSGDRVPCNEIKDDVGPYSDILYACTRKDPSKRFQSVSDLRDAILSIQYQQNMVPAPPNDFTQMLLNDAPIEQHQLRLLSREIEKKINTPEVTVLFNLLSIPKINQMYTCDAFSADEIAIAYSEWAKTNVFSFSSCDGVAQRLATLFALSSSVHVKAEALLALLYMGTSHNRWYVEHKFYELCGKSLPNAVATRLSLEIRVDNVNACKAVSHLMRSISVSLDGLHNLVAETIRNVCNI